MRHRLITARSRRQKPCRPAQPAIQGITLSDGEPKPSIAQLSGQTGESAEVQRTCLLYTSLVAPYARDSESSVTASAPPNVNTFLDSLIRQSEKLIGKPAALMNKEEKIRAIRFISESGAFLITRSGEKVSRFFGISKFTLYSYCLLYTSRCV